MLFAGASRNLGRGIRYGAERIRHARCSLAPSSERLPSNGSARNGKRPCVICTAAAAGSNDLRLKHGYRPAARAKPHRSRL
jgi:hypothetical protein